VFRVCERYVLVSRTAGDLCCECHAFQGTRAH
jgi:hypothetical protein